MWSRKPMPVSRMICWVGVSWVAWLREGRGIKRVVVEEEGEEGEGDGEARDGPSGMGITGG